MLPCTAQVTPVVWEKCDRVCDICVGESAAVLKCSLLPLVVYATPVHTPTHIHTHQDVAVDTLLVDVNRPHNEHARLQGEGKVR